MEKTRGGKPLEKKKVMVVENASPGAAEARAIAEKHGARFLELGDNRGYGGGVNAGAPSHGGYGKRGAQGTGAGDSN